MTTVDALITRIRSHPLLGGRRPTIDRLNGGINNTVTTLAVDFSNPLIRAGSYIELGYELMYVTGGTLPSVNVIRGMHGTTAASHSDDALITVEPRWTKQQILEAMQDEIRSWPNDLCAITTVELTFGANTPAVDLTGSSGKEVRRIFRAEAAPTDATYGYRKLDVELLTRQSTSNFASGNAVQIVNGLTYGAGTTVRVTYGYQFDADTFTSSTDLETGLGFTANLLNVLIAGTVWRLLLNSEAELTNLGVSAGAGIVQPTHRVQAAQAAREDRDRLIAMEIRRLYDEFGVRGG